MDERYDDSAVRREIAELSDRLDDLPDRWELDRKHRELSESIDEVRRDLDNKTDELEHSLERDIERSQDDLRTEHEQARAVLDRRLRRIERHIRAASGTATEQLDPTPELTALALLADRGETLVGQLLPPATRAARQTTVKAWESWQSTYRSTTAAAITASRAIASTDPDHPDRPKAIQAFRAARVALDGLTARRERAQQAAANAAAQLTRDDVLQSSHAAEIAAGKEAWTALTTRIRTRLAGAVERAELLPVWFDTVLGMTPPHESDAWLQAGTELIAYRTTYGISDPVVALGPEPDNDASDRRSDWHARLTILLRVYR